uniref:RNA-dependent RNA polymerase n=1 Tax=Mito-like laruketanusvirus TaxID=2784753 RepID=A0A7S7BUA2_9VIRU|nr:RNA-dependent RNA polymerase [Mito-like laruketanusvirus]
MRQRILQKFSYLWHACVPLRPENLKIFWSCCWQYTNFYLHLRTHHGETYAIKVLKEVHQVCKRCRMGKSPKQGIYLYPHWLSTTRTGLPRKLSKLSMLVESRHETLKFLALTITSAYLLLKVDPSHDLEEVTSPYSGYSPDNGPLAYDQLKLSYPLFDGKDRFVKDPKIMYNLLMNFIRNFAPKWKTPNFFRKDSHIFSGFKGGPFGVPSFRYAPRDANLLLNKFSNLKESILGFLELGYGAEAATDWRKSVVKADAFFKQFVEKRFAKGAGPEVKENRRKFPDGILISKLIDRVARFSFLSEKGGKTRVITAVNYFVQSALFKFHHDVMNCLGTIKQDFAFDQDRCASYIFSCFKRCKGAFSYDMKGATNRFPRFLQVHLLNCFIEGLGDKWGEIVSLDIFDSKSKTFHSFSVGQPMGIYSSWPVFSLSHHILVRFCAWCVGLDPFSFDLYCILGDDVVIFHRKVARCYHYMLTEVLGVDISASKSFESPSSKDPVAEFAKRNFVADGEVSPLSPSILISLREGKDPSLVKDILHRVLGLWKLKVKSHSEMVCEFFKATMPSRMGNRVMTWFLSPGVLPPSIDTTGRLDVIKNEHWPEYYNRFNCALLGRVCRQLEIFDVSVSKLENYMGLIPRIYPSSLQFVRNPSKPLIIGSPLLHGDEESTTNHIFRSASSKPLSFKMVSDVAEHPTQAVMRQILTRLDELKESENPRDFYRLVAIVEHFRCFFKGKVVRGDFYSVTNKIQVLSTYQGGKLARAAWEKFSDYKTWIWKY